MCCLLSEIRVYVSLKSSSCVYSGIIDESNGPIRTLEQEV